MILLSSIIETFEAEFLAQYQDSILPGHACALAAMKTCRTSLSPKMLAQCDECDEQVIVPHSCGHRNCPHCQHHESQQWLERQLKKQVPGDYFLLTFTLPAELRDLAWQHQRQLYALMIQCSWETVHTFSCNDPQLQGTPGAVTVLHTHSRRLDYHPHVHLAMPAAAMDANSRLWRTKTGKTRANQAICSITKHWPRCFGPRCWRPSKARDLSCRRAIPNNGSLTASGSARVRRRWSIWAAISIGA